MTTHYLKDLGVAKCREILNKATANRRDTYCCDSDAFFNQMPIMKPCADCLSIDDLRAELSLHDTDDFTHLANHISPNTKVVG